MSAYQLMRASSVVYPDLVPDRNVPNFLARSQSIPNLTSYVERVSIAPYRYSNLPIVRYRSNWPYFYPNYRSSWTSRYYKYLYDYDHTPLINSPKYPLNYYSSYYPYRRYYDYPYNSVYDYPHRAFLLATY
uniref:Uncharacterized protein n=1 Tax=Ditylenchus dipsaci TaxID=166011 RepID=A0A915DA56_9BILA